MIGTSKEYQEITQGPHHSVALVEVYQNDKLVKILAAHDGAVDADKNNAILRRFDAKVTDPTGALTPEGIRDLLAPFGTIIKLYRGVKIPVVIQVFQIFSTDAAWNTGTFNRTAADNGDLIIQ